MNQRGPIGTALSTTGAYILSYTVVFDSETLRGQLAPLTVASANLLYAGNSFTGVAHYPAIGPLYYVGNGGDLSTAGTTAYQTVLGSQPSGYAQLVYTCESTTWTPTSVTVYYPGNLVYVNQAAGTTALAQYMYIRLQTSYHQVIIGVTDTIDGSLHLFPIQLTYPPTLPWFYIILLYRTPGDWCGSVGRFGHHQVAHLPLLQEDRPARHGRVLLLHRGGREHADGRGLRVLLQRSHGGQRREHQLQQLQPVHHLADLPHGPRPQRGEPAARAHDGDQPGQ